MAEWYCSTAPAETPEDPGLCMTSVDKRQHLTTLFEAAAGPLTWADSDTACGAVHGQPVMLSVHIAKIASGRTITGGQVTIDLGGRAIAMLIDNRQRTHASLPVVRTGDDAFDDVFMIQGWPEGALRTAFDPDIRRWITGEWPEGWPPLIVENDRLIGRFTVFRHDGSNWVASSADFQRQVEGTSALAVRLIGAYDAERSEVIAIHGEEAGDEWEASLERQQARRATKRGALRVVVFGSFALACLLIMFAVFASAGIF